MDSLWELDEKVPDSIPDRANLGKELSKLVLVRVFRVMSRSDIRCSDTHTP